MRKKLSLETRAKRRASRINNKRAAEAPLLAYAGVLEQKTVEEAASDLQSMDDAHKAHVEALDALDADFERRAGVFREAVQTLVSLEVFEALDTKSRRPYYAGAYLCDFWRGTLRRLSFGFKSPQGVDYGMTQ